MASCSRSLRTGMRLCAKATSSPQKCTPASRPFAATTAYGAGPERFNRTFSTTPRRRKDEDEDVDGDLDSEDRPRRSAETEHSKRLDAALASQGPQALGEIERLALDLARSRGEMSRMSHVARPDNFWYENDRSDSDLDLDVRHEDPENDEIDISTQGHAKFETYREYREYARLAAWQLPLLSKLAKPFEPPTSAEPLRFRYTTYMGEEHPAQNKVVVEFAPRDLPLTEAEQLKLKKLLGVRYNPETEVAKISCEQYEHQAQNKRYLGDLVDKLIVQAKDKTDTFEDIPLDTRHHKFKPKIKFPIEWRMTQERRELIDSAREKSLLLDETKTEQGLLIDGKQKIAEAHALRAQQEREKRRLPVHAYTSPAAKGRGAPARR